MTVNPWESRIRGAHGYDAVKKVNGRKREIMVDTQGLLLEVLVHPGDISDRIGGALLLNKFKESGEYPNIKIIWVDRGYKWFKLIEYAKNKWNIEISVVERPQIRGVW